MSTYNDKGRRIAPGSDPEVLQHVFEIKQEIAKARQKETRKDSSWKYRHTEKGIDARKNYRKNTVKGIQHRINTLINRRDEIAAAKMLSNQKYDTGEMFWDIKEQFPEMSMEGIVKVMSMRPSNLRGQESILEFLDSLGDIQGPGAEFYNYPGGSDI
jgi:hypothetical protein